MRPLYFDTSYLGKLRWPEPGSAEVLALASGGCPICCSIIGRAEFHSLSHRKTRENAVAAQAARIVCAQFETDCAAGALRLLPLTQPIVDRVARAYALAPSQLFLRAADALHLATAAEHGFAEIHSNDLHLLAAAPFFGLRGVNVIP